MRKKLSEREFQIVQFLVLGMTNKEIARELNISIHTVKAHLEDIYDKLKINNRIQASIVATIEGIIDIKEIQSKYIIQKQAV